MRASRRWLVAFTASVSLGTALAADQTTHDALTALAGTYIAETARYDPIYATGLGLTRYDRLLPQPSEAARAARIAQLRTWRKELDRIVALPPPLQAVAKASASTSASTRPGVGTSAGVPMAGAKQHVASAASSATSASFTFAPSSFEPLPIAAGATLVDSNDARLLRAQFDADLNDFIVRQRDRKNLAGPSLRLVDGIFNQFLHLPVVGQAGATQADLDHAWDAIVARLADGSDFITAAEKLVTRPGRLFGIVGAKQLDGVPEFFNGALTSAAEEQLARRPLALVQFIDARNAALATMARTRATIEAKAAGWPENFAIGKAAYEQMLRDEQLLPFDAADLDRIARDELAHGWAEEAWLTALSAQRREPFGAASGGGMAPGGSALIGYYRDRIGELRQFVDKLGVVTVPAWLGTMEIVETPPFLQPVSPGASMVAPRLFSTSTTGYYFITPPVSLEDAAKRLDMNQDFDRDRIWSTAAHEAMPGHFFQLSIAHRHPSFVRKIQDSAAFAEGWAFYGEEMFVRLGLYGDDLDARLFTARWERVRGARAIVDPKLASGEWSVPQAAAFFEAQSGFTKEASEAAVRGIALGPGYVISYTVGRLQLETLLAEYLRRMGDRGSLHDFHDRLLSYGSVPFAVLGPELLADLDKPAAVVRDAAGY